MVIGYRCMSMVVYRHLLTYLHEYESEMRVAAGGGSADGLAPSAKLTGPGAGARRSRPMLWSGVAPQALSHMSKEFEDELLFPCCEFHFARHGSGLWMGSQDVEACSTGLPLWTTGSPNVIQTGNSRLYPAISGRALTRS